MFQGGFVSWFLFYSFLPFALYSLSLALYKMKNIELQREFTKAEYNAGERLVVKVKMKRRSSFPLFYMVIEDSLSEELTFSMKSSSAKTFVFPYFHKSIEFEYVIDELPRGEHHFKGIHIKIGDPLGLIEQQINCPTVDDKIMVYPAYEEIIYRTMDNHYDQGMTASRERVQRDTSMAIGIRDYQPGDRFSWINWKATAKRNEIMTKEFEQRKSHDVYVVMDCAPDHHFEVVVSFVASILRAILKKGAQVGLLSSSAERVAFPTRSGDVHLQQLNYHLAKVKASSPVPLEVILEGEGFTIGQNASLMLVTGQLTKSLIEKASYFSSRNGIVTIFLMKNRDESTTDQEKALKAQANARGVRVVFVHSGQFTAAFTEVNRG